MATFAELHRAIAQGEQRIVLTHAYIVAGVVMGAALTHDDITGDALLTTIYLNAQTFAFAFTSVSRTTYTFFMCHFYYVFFLLNKLCLVDAVYLDLGEIVAVAIHLLEAFATNLAEYQHLLAFYVFQYGGFHVSASDVRLTYSNIAIIVFEHHGVKRYFAAFLVLETVHKNLLIFSYLELLACDFYYCVHLLLII